MSDWLNGLWQVARLVAVVVFLWFLFGAGRRVETWLDHCSEAEIAVRDLARNTDQRDKEMQVRSLIVMDEIHEVVQGYGQ